MKQIVGVDEVGRGPIAGPVSVGVFATTAKNILKIIKSAPYELKDSKKLTKTRRESWYAYLKECKNSGLCDFAVNMQSNIVIDCRGIMWAIRTATKRAFGKLKISKDAKILCDAGLTPPDGYDDYVSLVKGDEREAVIAMASIVAKVERDAVMAKYAKKYPDYGFESNVGYGTEVHYIALKHKGILQIHRKTFL